jgi:replicative DNA helicase
MRDHVLNYGVLPSRAALSASGYILREELPESADYYIDKAKLDYVRRKGNLIAKNIRDTCNSSDHSRLNQLQMELRALLSSGQSLDDVVSFAQAGIQALERARQALYTDLVGFPTGWPILDQLTGGWQAGDLNVIVGRPSTGKSYVLLQSIYANWLAGNSILFVTLEMSTIQMVTRMLAKMHGLNPDRFKDGLISNYQMDDMRAFVATVDRDMAPFYFMMSETSKTIGDIENAVERTNADAVYIDASYLLTSNQRGRKSRTEEKAEVLEELKNVALRTQKPFTLTYQFNRGVKSNQKAGSTDQSISLEDIGETDKVGQIATNVIAIHPPNDDPVSRRRRTISIIKAREGENIKFLINYLFEPPNFDYIGTVVDDELASVAEDDARRSLEANGWG